MVLKDQQKMLIINGLLLAELVLVTIQIIDQLPLPLILSFELITDLRILSLSHVNRKLIDDPVGCKDHLAVICNHGVKCN